jgi:hypothetical protein
VSMAIAVESLQGERNFLSTSVGAASAGAVIGLRRKFQRSCAFEALLTGHMQRSAKRSVDGWSGRRVGSFGSSVRIKRTQFKGTCSELLKGGESGF